MLDSLTASERDLLDDAPGETPAQAAATDVSPLLGLVLGSSRMAERIRFVLVGGFNTVFGFAVFAGFNAIMDGYVLALLAAHVVSVLVAFTTQRLLVFRARGGAILEELVRFWSVYATQLTVNLVVLPLLVEVGGLPVLPAQVLFTVGLAIMSYVAGRRWIFRHGAARR